MTTEPVRPLGPPVQRLWSRLSRLGVFLVVVLAGQGCGNNNPSERALERGGDAMRRQDYDLAITEFSEAIRLKPDYADAYFDRGVASHRKGDYDKAIADYGEAIRLRPDYVNAYIERGRAYDHKGDYDKVIADYTEAIRRDPNQATIYLNRGNTYNRQGDYDKAIADYTEAIRLNLDYAFACEEGRARAYRQKGDDAKAIADYTDAIRRKPDEVMAYYNRGLIYGDAGDDARAIADYNEVIRLKPDYADAYNNLGWLLAVCPDATVRDGAKAVAYAKKACELSEWKTPSWFRTLAAAYAEAGDFENAVKWEGKYLESNPSKDASEKAHQRLSLYEQNKPYHEEKR
jgi:tetratricopeptide (TPR) repeat protein